MEYMFYVDVSLQTFLESLSLLENIFFNLVALRYVCADADRGSMSFFCRVDFLLWTGVGVCVCVSCV